MNVNRVALVGATGALGSAIIEVLDRASWRPQELIPLASRATKQSHVEYGDRSIAVDNLEDEAIDGLDGILLACPPKVAVGVGLQAIRQGIPVVDCSGAMVLKNAPLCVPWVNPEVLAASTIQASCLPPPEAILLASILGPLRRAGLVGPASALVMNGASRYGREGIHELSKQVTALFNSQPPPRKVFESGLAFDVVALSEEVDGTGQTAMEAAIGAAAAKVAGTEHPVDVQRVVIPAFSGICVDLQISVSADVPVERIRQILIDGGVVVEENDTVTNVPRPRRIEGNSFAHASRIRKPNAHTIRLWGAMDNLTVSAGVAASSLAAMIQSAQS